MSKKHENRFRPVTLVTALCRVSEAGAAARCGAGLDFRLTKKCFREREKQQHGIHMPTEFLPFVNNDINVACGPVYIYI